MNKRDIKRLDAIQTMADRLMNAPKLESNHITDADVVEAILNDLGRAMQGKDACWLVALVARDVAARSTNPKG